VTEAKGPVSDARPQDRKSKTPIGSNRRQEMSVGATRFCAFVDETPGLGLVLELLPNSYEFSGEELMQFVERGLYGKKTLRGRKSNRV
jgi:hypothetical protein